MFSKATRTGSLNFQTSLTFIIAFIVVGSMCLGATAHAAVGRTPGTFAVSPTGAATYTIPISVPPGPGGVQPTVALTYNSQQGNGYVGVGWSLSGLSAIYRCNLTYAQDAAPAPVSLATNDGYCLDGQRLRLTSGAYGTNRSTYQTEIANFVNVTAGVAAGAGPGNFSAQTPDGHIYFYGDSPTSQVIPTGTQTATAWMLNEITDAAGNTMTISYNTANGSAIPATISWTPTSAGASTYAYTMVFSYTSAQLSSSSAYVAGEPISDTNLLASITVNYGGSPVKEYVLQYQQSPTTGREELVQVQECAGSGTSNCLAPTIITYQAGQAGVTTSATTIATLSGSSPQVVRGFDFNGDGRMDLAWYVSGIWYVALSTGSSYGTPINTGITDAAALFGNVLPNANDGILARNGGQWSFYTLAGSSFSPTTTGLSPDCSICALADVDGDGRPDLVGINTDGWIHTRLNTSSGTSPTFSSVSTQAYNAAGEIGSINSNFFWTGGGRKSRNFDFNGDGRADLIVGVTGANWVLVSTGSTSSGITFVKLPVSYDLAVGVGDWNDDGCSDVVTRDTVFISACNGDAPTTIGIPSGTVVALMDWDGDGRTDAVVSNGSTLGVYLSTSAGISSTITTTSIPYNGGAFYYPNDVDGDGLADLITVDWVSPYALQFQLHNGAGQQPDLLSSVTDGYGNQVSPVYQSIAQTQGSWYFPYADATYPYANYIGPMYVVNWAFYSDPSAQNAAYMKYFFYSGAWLNLQGRGFAGFAASQVHDMRNNTWETSSYDRTFPYTGMVTSNLTAQNNPATLPISVRQNALASITVNGTAYNENYFPYVSNSTVQTYEVGGTENGQLVKTSSSSYTYDDHGNLLTGSTTLTDNDTGSAYYGNSWTTTTSNTPDVNSGTSCQSLLTQSQVTYTATIGNTAPPLTKQFTVNPLNCRYSQVVTQPNTGYTVTENFTFDSFGNVSTDVVTGAGMTPRTTTASWGNTGQFPMSVTDPSGATTQYNYNFNFGLVSSRTDPNGTATSWQYDGFGRLTRETRPDTTYTMWTYEDCVSWVGCPIGTHELALLYQDFTAGGTQQSAGTTWYDPLQRPLISNQLSFSGGWNQVQTSYDSLGRVTKRSIPCVWSSLTTPCPYMTTTAYDLIGRPTSVSRPISASNSGSATTNYAYAGRKTISTDPQSNATTIVRDVNGWLRETEDPYGYIVTTAYDTAGNRVGVTDSVGNTLWSGTYAYGVSPFLLSATDMDLGPRSFTVDALGERTAWTDGNSQSFSETYDALSRPLTRTEPDQFTQWTWGSSASSYNIGKLQSVCMGPAPAPGSNGICTSSYYSESETYDSAGRLFQRAITIPSTGTLTYSWVYNATTGLLNSLTYPISTAGAALQLQYAYQNGLPLSVTAVVPNSPNVTVWQANATDAAGRLTQETLGNGIVTNRAFDADTGWLNSIQSGVGGGSGVQNQSFLYDYVGNVTQRQDNNLGLTENIYYDNDYRLTSSKLGSQQNLAITYDETGNITSRSDVSGGATWTYDPVRKHAVTQAGSNAYAYSYDGNGNAIGRQGSSIQWSSYNYPTSIGAGSGSTAESVAFSYGPDRQRWQQSYAGNGITESTTYVGGSMEVVSSGGVTDYRHYISANGHVVAVYSRKSNGTNAFSYLLSDHQDSIASITNSSGASVVNESFTPFGAHRNPTSWSGPDTTLDLTTGAGITREGYTFQTALGLWMGLNHMNGRVQDSVTGRFLSADPQIPDRTNAQDYNRYSYVNNNPLSLTDPSGFDDCPGPCDLSPEWNDPDLTVYYSNGLTYDGGVGFFGNITLSTDTGSVTIPAGSAFDTNGTFSNRNLYNVTVGAPVFTDSGAEPNLLGVFNANTGDFESAWDGFSAPPQLELGMMGAVGTFSLQTRYAAQATLSEFGRQSAIAGAAQVGGLAIGGLLRLATGAAGGATTSVFWSGPGTQAAAEAWAAANGGTTLSVAASASAAETTAASADFAAQATGNVVVFQNAVQGVPLGGFWAQIEFGALSSNPNVTGIIYNIIDDTGATISTIFSPK